jgi:glycosyltransferase involved in cell wall biosynthesis
LWAGIQAARGDIFITLDADLQNPPSDCPHLLEALRNADCICGSRIAARAQGDSWLRRASAKIANSVRNELSDETISDAGCCFRAFRRECVATVKFFRGGHRFLPTLIKMEGYRVVEVPVSHHPRRFGHSHYGIWNRLFKSSADLLGIRWMKTRSLCYQVAETVN